MRTPFEASDVVEIARQSILMIVLLACPALAVSLVVGLLSGFLQAVTQIQDQTISFVAKMLAVLATIAVLMPWILEKLTEYSAEIFSQPWGL